MKEEIRKSLQFFPSSAREGGGGVSNGVFVPQEWVFRVHKGRECFLGVAPPSTHSFSSAVQYIQYT